MEAFYLCALISILFFYQAKGALNVCPKDQFQCDTGECVPLTTVCDGNYDCVDIADERNNCSCSATQSRCNNLLCVLSTSFCDSYNDCIDWSDELNCARNCATNEFECPEGCVPKEFQCDYYPDCSDGSDELGCPCYGTLLSCDNGLCLDPILICDGTDHCGDGSDEKNCVCGTGLSKCYNNLCLDSTYWCDGYNDCGDISDELSCACDASYSKCANQKCYPDSFRCDGDDDCGDGTDELNCVTTTLSTPTTTQPVTSTPVTSTPVTQTPVTPITGASGATPITGASGATPVTGASGATTPVTVTPIATSPFVPTQFDPGTGTTTIPPLPTDVAAPTYNELDSFPDPVSCSTDDVCLLISPMAICTTVAIDMGSNTIVHEKRCVCDKELTTFKHGHTCYFHSHMGESCDDDVSICVDPHTECQMDGHNQDSWRCGCIRGYARIKKPNVPCECARQIYSHTHDPACLPCEENDALCFDLDNDDKRDGCFCSVVQTGNDCEISLLNVTCDALSMKICYNPVPVYQTTPVVIAAEGHEGTLMCSGNVAGAGDPDCNPGELRLVLPFDSSGRHRCGTVELTSQVGLKRYENVMVVQPVDLPYVTHHLHAPTFTTFCTYRTHASADYSPIGVETAIRDQENKYTRAIISMVIQDYLGAPMPEAVSIRLGDKVRLCIIVGNPDVYKAIRVLSCQASSSATLGVQGESTLPLVINSCPYSNQNHITVANNWQPIQGESWKMQTGYIRMFKMSKGSLHIHCSVRLCMQAGDAACGPVDCTTRTARSAPSEGHFDKDETTSVLVSRELKCYSDDMIGSTDPDIVHTEAIYGSSDDVLVYLFWTMSAGSLVITLIFGVLMVTGLKLAIERVDLAVFHLGAIYPNDS